MTDLIAEQEAMLERLCRKHGLMRPAFDADHRFVRNVAKEDVLGFGRELLLAVQENHLRICKFYMDRHLGKTSGWRLCAEAIKTDIEAQTYGDLFPEETK